MYKKFDKANLRELKEVGRRLRLFTHNAICCVIYFV